MQEKNEQITDELKAEHPWMDGKGMSAKDFYIGLGLRGYKELEIKIFGDTTDYGKSEKRVDRPYQETSDDCSGNLFKKKI